MAHTDTWNAAFEAAPAATDDLGDGDDVIRQLKLAIRERFALDHYMDVAGTDADHGQHSKVTFQAPIAKPTAVANKGFVYGKDVSDKIELFWLDEDDHEVQLTSVGAISGSPGAVLTTRGDVMYVADGPVVSRLAVGASGQVLGTDGTDVAWGYVPLPLGYGAGCTLSLDTDTEHDINVTAGQWRDSSDTCNLVLAAETTKQLDAAFAAGDDAGGLFAGSVAANTWYHVFLIRKDADLTIDVGFSTSITAADIPAGYTEYRRIGSIKTNASSTIIAFRQDGDTFLWQTAVLDDITALTTSKQTITLDYIPTGVVVNAMLALHYAGGGALYYSVGNPADITEAVTSSNATGYGYDERMGKQHSDVLTNTSAQVAIRGSKSSTINSITVRGWKDSRGRNG